VTCNKAKDSATNPKSNTEYSSISPLRAHYKPAYIVDEVGVVRIFHGHTFPL